MKKYLPVLLVAAGLTQWGCEFLGGARSGQSGDRGGV